MSQYIQSNQSILLPNANYTVSAIDTGKLFFIPVVTGARQINLPAVQIGLHFRFMVKAGAAALGFDVSIVPPTVATVYGLLITQGVTAITIAGAIQNASNGVIFDSTAVTGDWLDVYCDGTYWHVSGMSQIAGGIF